MTAPLAPLFADKIVRCLDRIVALLDGLDDSEAAWRPALDGANSLAGIANHILANVEENVFSVLAGETSPRDRTVEFAPPGAAAVRARWAALRPRLLEAIAAISDEQLTESRDHPRRGSITIAELFMVILRHAGEHEGEAMLTRSLLRAPRD